MRKSKINFKNVNELAYFTADSTIFKQFKDSKSFPYEWDYVMSEEEIENISQKNVRDLILNDIPYFNDLVAQMIHKKLDWLLAEGFIVHGDEQYRFLSDQEIEAEIQQILSE